MKAQADLRCKGLGIPVSPTLSTTNCYPQNGAEALPRYFGSFQITKRIDLVSYQLELPPNSKVYPVFHVSLVKPYHGAIPPSSVET